MGCLRFSNKKTFLLPLLALLLVGLIGAAPGTKADPLVTKSWVDQYINRQTADIAADIEAVGDELAALQVVRLWMGRSTMEVNGSQIALDAAPFVTAAGRSYVPLRALGEAAAAEFKWDNDNKRVTYIRGGHTLQMRVGSYYAVADGVTVPIDAPPQLVNNRVFVPIRLVSENLGFAVNWLAAEKAAVVTWGS